MLDHTKESSIVKNMAYAMMNVRQVAESVLKSEMPGIIDNMDGTIFLLKKILRSDEPKTIGFFGAQKRGKSSIVNYLLGVELMPTGAIPMSSVIVRVKHDSSIQKDRYNIDVTERNGQLNQQKDLSEEDARSVIESYGSHRNDETSQDIDTIEVSSNFSGIEILEDGGILVDTPGVEMAFSDEGADEQNMADAERAECELQETHLVVFVERADYLEAGSGYQFFSKQIKQLRPLSVVSFKDKIEGAENVSAEVAESIKQKKLGSLMMKVYGINLDRFACVSCEEANAAQREQDKELSGMLGLKRKILKELRNLGFEEGLWTSLLELEKSLKLVAMNRGKNVARQVFAPATLPFCVMKNDLASLVETEETENKFGNIQRSIRKIEEILDAYRLPAIEF